MAAVTIWSEFGAQKNKVWHCFHCFPIYLGIDAMGPDAMIFVLWMFSFKPTFSLSSFTFIKRLFSSSSLYAIKGGVICISEVIDFSPGNLDSSLCFFQPSISHDVLWYSKPSSSFNWTTTENFLLHSWSHLKHWSISQMSSSAVFT